VDRKINWKYLFAIGAALTVLVVGSVFFLRLRRPITLRATDSVVLADFTNTTGDSVFDGALRQGLAVQLEQSPFLSLVSEDRIQQTLGLMGQPADSRLTPVIAREICQRTGSTAVLEGAITQIGTPYLITLTVVSCVNGQSLASSEAQGSDKNHVLDALGKTASEIRSKLGESLITVQKFATPLEQATTPSLEALKAYSAGVKVQSTTGDSEAIPFFKHAIELDPNFALDYAELGIAFTTIGEPSIGGGYTRKAYELRNQTSEQEKYYISAIFHKEVTGDLEKAEQSCKLWIQAYPRAEGPHIYLSGAIYPGLGYYEKAAEEAREAIHLKPDSPTSYVFLMFGYIGLNRLDEAKGVYGQALERKLNNTFYPPALYEIAFLQNDAVGMAKQVEGQRANPEWRTNCLAWKPRQPLTPGS